MLNRPARRRRGEQGQVLVLALAFLVFFGLIAAALFSYASVVEFQHGTTETTAASDSRVDGGALFALADAARDHRTCTRGEGTVTMQNGDVVGYQRNPNGCNPGMTSATQCVLCLLSTGTALAGPGGPLPGTVVVTGPIAVNGLAKGPLIVTSALGPKQFIGCQRAACSDPRIVFSPAPKIITKVDDPMGNIPAPFPNQVCQPDPGGAGGALASGLYCTIHLTEVNHIPTTYTLGSGTYGVTGAFQIDPGVILKSDPTQDFLLYFGCGDSSGNLVPCKSPLAKTSGYLDVAVGGALTFPALPPSTTIGTAVMFDPNDAGVAVPACGGNVVAICFEGLGSAAVIDGTVYGGQLAAFYIGPGAIATIRGRLVVGSLILNDMVPLTLDGSATTVPSCWVYDDSTTSGSSPRVTGHVVLDAGCGQGGTGIIDINYGP